MYIVENITVLFKYLTSVRQCTDQISLRLNNETVMDNLQRTLLLIFDTRKGMANPGQ